MDDAVYFLGSGYYRYDGANLRLMSDAITPELIPATMRIPRIDSAGLFPPATANQVDHIAAAYLPGGGIFLSLAEGRTAAQSTGYFAGIFDVNRGTWTKFSSAVLGDGASRPMLRAAYMPAVDRTIGHDGHGAFGLTELAQPETALSDDASYALRDLATSGSFAAIPAKLHSRIARLASPTHRAQLQRLLLDYRFQLASGADGSADGWYVSIMAGDGSTLLPEFQVPAQGNPSSFLYRRRASKEVFSEAVDAQLRVEWRGSTAALRVKDGENSPVATMGIPHLVGGR